MGFGVSRTSEVTDRPGVYLAPRTYVDWSFLSFLAEPWFVIPWYAVGAIGAAIVGYDLRANNTPLKQAMKWAWPIIVLFFSILGILLYVTTARAPGIGEFDDPDRKQEAHDRYEQNMMRRVNGAVIHCVAGDGLGIMTAMIIVRAIRTSFWQEFWFEYAVGFAFGWFIFQRKSMKMMTANTVKALAMAFRAEFFSMLTVMAGMGAVMAYVTPMAVTAQPRPLTYAFWGFGMLGLIVGYVFTFPMNYLIVKIGWKHGMGSKRGSRPVQSRGAKWGLFTAMLVLGIGAEILPGWLAIRREHRRVAELAATPVAGPAASRTSSLLAHGLEETTDAAIGWYDRGAGTNAAVAIDAAYRAAEVGDHAVPGTAFGAARERLDAVRRAMWVGRWADARRELAHARDALRGFSPPPATMPRDPALYAGAYLLDARGNNIGEVYGVRDGRVELSIGGIHDFWGFWDLSGGSVSEISPRDLLYGPVHTVGWRFAVLPTFGPEAVAQHEAARATD